jgi:chromosome segregation ATPase
VTRDGETTDVDPVTFTVDPAAGTVRFAFLVDRAVAKRAEAELAITVPSHGRLELPARVELPPLDSTDVAIGSVLAGTRTGDELVATMNLFERRCAIAERVADDLRSMPTEGRKLAQSYRESSELRALLESREEAHTQSAGAVEKAEADAAERAAEAATARAELAGLRSTLEDTNARHAVELAERDATIERLEAEMAAGNEAAETWQTEVATAREQLAAAVGESEGLERGLTEARETVEALQSELAAVADQADAWAAEAERARTQLVEAVDRAQLVQEERDGARASLAELDAALRAAEAELDVEVTAARTELEHAVSTATAEVESARTVLQDAAARTDELARERDDERATRNQVEQELARSRALAADTEARLEREQSLYEARIASAVETERKLRRQVADLEAKLADQPRSLPGFPRRKAEPITQQFAEAQRARLRHTTLEEQRAQVAALERQLEQLKQDSPNASRDASPVGLSN